MGEQSAGQGRVTLEEVRVAVDLMGVDPRKTNAIAIRDVIGHGGPNTIQKHLESLRRELAAPEKENGTAAPEAPKELMQSIWAAAWTEASRQHAVALNKALARAEAADHQLQVASDDLSALAEALERTEAERDQVKADLDAALERARAAEVALDAERQAIAMQKAILDDLMERFRAILPTPTDPA